MLKTRSLAIARLSRPVRPRIPFGKACFSQMTARRAEAEDDDPEQNGGYINPPFVKRQHRDPYGDWTDKQERRNFGEPLHEHNDTLGMFTPYEYTHMGTGMGLIMWAGFISIVLGLSGAVYAYYPDIPSAPREFEDGLERELGGPHALRARMEGDPV